MELKLKKKSLKPGRYKYFQLCIYSGIPAARLKVLNTQNIFKILTLVKFVCQEILEKLLCELELEHRGRLIKIKKFAGQLERDSISGSVCWHILLQTTSLITAPCLGRVVSQKLFQTKTRVVDPRIEIKSEMSFAILNKERRLKIPKSCWYPGYFTDATVKLASLLEEEEVQRSIKDNPNKYRGLIQNLENLSK